MPLELSTSDADFAGRFADFVDAGRETATDVSAAVSGIIADVRARGDAAVLELTARFDRLDTTTLRFTDAEISAAKDTIAPDLRAALELAAERIPARWWTLSTACSS